MARRSRPRRWLLIGVACGLLSVVLVKSLLFVLLGSVNVLVVVGGVVLLWLFLRGPRDGRP